MNYLSIYSSYCTPFVEKVQILSYNFDRSDQIYEKIKQN